MNANALAVVTAEESPAGGSETRQVDMDALRGPLVELPVRLGQGGPVAQRTWWGQPWQLGTAAYWVQLTLDAQCPRSYTFGRCLEEELAACILGGFGMPASTATAAFVRVRDAGILREPQPVDVRERALLHALQTPLLVDGISRRYRFPRQRARRLAAALAFLDAGVAPSHPVELRDWLLDAPGVGPKTASWVVRNHLSSDEVAIIDVHVHRAGIAAGVFDVDWQLPRDYQLFEDAFLAWARHGRVSPALLDACIWGVLAGAGRMAADVLGTAVGPLRPVWPVTG